MSLLIITVGGTIDKVYFDATSEYEVGDPTVPHVYQGALVTLDYEVLPHVIDVDEAMKEDAPVLHKGRQQESVPKGYSENVLARSQYGHGDIEAGFAQADLIVERSFTTAATHQGYIEPHACLATMGNDGQGDLWCCTQGHYMVRNTCSAIMGMEAGRLRVTASELGGGVRQVLDPVQVAPGGGGDAQLIKHRFLRVAVRDHRQGAARHAAVTGRQPRGQAAVGERLALHGDHRIALQALFPGDRHRQVGGAGQHDSDHCGEY